MLNYIKQFKFSKSVVKYLTYFCNKLKNQSSYLLLQIQKNIQYIGHVHFADSNRRPVGNGHTRFVEVAKALKEINYQGYVSAEAFPWPTPKEAAAQTILSFKKYFKI